MKTIYPMTLVVNATKPVMMGCALAVAMMFPHADGFAKQGGTDILHFNFMLAIEKTSVDPDASGQVTGKLNRQGNASNQRLKISLNNLDANTTYQLAAVISDDITSTRVMEFTTDSKGAFTVKYVSKSQGKGKAGGQPLPDTLNPLNNIRELDVINSSAQTVLRTGAGKLRYLVKHRMDNTGFIPNATGFVQMKATITTSQFRLTATGLTAHTDYVLMLNGSIVQTNTTDSAGNLNLTTLPPGAPDVLDIHSVGLTDLAGNLILTVDTGLGIPADRAPTVSSTFPANAATGVAIGGNIAAVFSEAMDPLTITTATFTLKQGVTPVAGAVSYVGVTATFNPTSELAPSTVYTATITTGARDLAGNALAAGFSWSFTTGTTLDTTAPSVSSIFPANGSTGVAIGGNVAVVFSEAMDPLTITTGTFILKQGTTPVAGAVTYVGVTATFNPTGNLLPSTTYTATITTGARDLAGNALAADFSWSFTTGTTSDTTRPTVSSVFPANGDTGVAIGGNVAVIFSEAMDPLTITTATFTLQHGATPVAGVVTYAGVTAIFNPTANLLPSSTYTATITIGARDLAGNALAAGFIWSFTTGTAPDTTAPTVSSTVPANGDLGVAIGGNIAAVFSEVMNPLTINTTTFTLRQGATPVVGTVSYAGVTATFNPTSNLLPNTTYTATITTGARDLAGNALAADFVWSFTTGTTTDTTPPTIISTVPVNGITGVTIGGNIAVAFSEAMDPLTINTTTFTLRQGATPVVGTVSYAGVTATFNPTSNLLPNTTYTATITTEARDLAGNALAADFVWSFTTGTTTDTTPPTIISTIPVNGATAVAANQTIYVTFSEAMAPLTINTANFKLTGPGETGVTGTVAYDVVNNIAAFTPAGNLAPLTPYTVTITTGARDLAGNALAMDFVLSYSTGSFTHSE